MRVFHSEFAHAHDLLTFAYSVYAEREADDRLADIYRQGFLPYSGSPDAANLFYLSRSVRVFLPEFECDSECRRITKKFDGLFESHTVSIQDFPYTDDVREFWLAYYDEVHGPGVMPGERLDFIFGKGPATFVTTYHDESGAPAAYVLEVHDGDMAHVWYTSYATSLIKKSFGMWLLIDAVRRAKAGGLQYFYLGTAYGSKTSYKTNFPNLEHWNGKDWVKDAKNKLLKELAKTDSSREHRVLDSWKREHKLFFEKP